MQLATSLHWHDGPTMSNRIIARQAQSIVLRSTTGAINQAQIAAVLESSATALSRRIKQDKQLQDQVAVPGEYEITIAVDEVKSQPATGCPQALRKLLMRMIDRDGQTHAKVNRICSVMGRHCSPEALAAVTDELLKREQ